MLRDGAMTMNSSEMMTDARSSWQSIDRELRSIARRQRALDAEEAELVCRASREQVWRKFGCATMLEYLELIFGYAPKVGHERLRVAIAIDELTDLRDALASGDLSYSALRELTRVVTPEVRSSSGSMRCAATVFGRSRSSCAHTRRATFQPTRRTPDLKPRRLQFEVSPATHALVRQARQALADERGRFVEDDELMAAMAAAILERGDGETDHGRAKHQIRMTTCEACSQMFQEGGGRKLAIERPDAERAECDAQRLGKDQRATQDIAPKTRREVWHRDGGKCQIPGCRSARFLEVHHIVARSDGGSHDATNLTVLCDGHHTALHRQKIVIAGAAPNIDVRFVNQPADPQRAMHATTRHATAKIDSRSRVERNPHVETPPKLDGFAVMAAEAKQALESLKFKPARSRQLVDWAIASEPTPVTLEELIRVALRYSR